MSRGRQSSPETPERAVRLEWEAEVEHASLTAQPEPARLESNGLP